MNGPVATEPTPDYSWGEYLGCMEGAPDDVVELAPARHLDPAAWGLLVCLCLTVTSMQLNNLKVWPFTLPDGRHPLEPVIMSIVLGMAIGNVRKLPKVFQPGIKFSVKKLLPLGIILLGARLNFFDILRLGFEGVLLSCFEIVLALALMWFLTRQLRLSGKLGTLLAVGTAICGGTAIVATAPVIEAEEGEVVFGVATVTLLGLIGMFVLPMVGHLMGLPEQAFGIWAGLAIHQTPQVVAAGFAYGQHAGETATIIKMSRVCMLAPVVFVIGLIYARKKAQQRGKSGGRGRMNYFSLFPKFVLGFLALALLRTLGWLPEFTVHMPQAAGIGNVHRDFDLATLAQWGANFCIIMSMAGVGLETKFMAMRKTGWRPFFAAAASALVIAAGILGLLQLLRIS